MSLTGKVALVTGAAQGLGKGFAEALLKKGAKVCLVDVNDKGGEATAAKFREEFGEGKVLFVKCDVSSPTDWKKTFAKLLDVFGHLDVMVNNAGIMDESEPIHMVGINLTGMILGTNLAIKVMRKDKGGNGGIILNISSRAGIRPDGFFAPVYCATKYGVAGFTRAWSRNPYLKQMGLRFACLCPALTPTAILNPMNVLYPMELMKYLLEGLNESTHALTCFCFQRNPYLKQMGLRFACLCPALTPTAILNPMNVLYPMELMKYLLEGLNEISSVVAGFLQLVEDEDCNGAVMTVHITDGIQYFEKPLAHSKM